MSDAPNPAYDEAIARAEKAARGQRGTAALLAYAEAAAAAPDQALPYIEMGNLHLESRRDDQALEAFDGALRRAPRNQVALGGRAQALERLGRPAEAAEALDLLATTCEGSGRLLDALVASRHALELAESRQRRRALTDLVGRVRGHAFADAGPEAALMLDELEAAESVLGLADGDDGPPVRAEVAAALVALERAEDARRAGDVEAARRDYVEAARSLADADLRDPALDACFDALAVAPDDIELHLTLAEIYASAGWTDHLAAKADVVRRFLVLQPDAQAEERLATIVAGAAG